MRRAVDNLVARLASPSPAAWEGGRGVIRSVRFSVPDDGRWVDNAGHDIDAVGRSSHDVWVDIGDPSAPVLQVQLAPGNSPADVLAQLAPATWLSLRNAQLAAVANARLADVPASRDVVAASDGERRRMETRPARRGPAAPGERRSLPQHRPPSAPRAGPCAATGGRFVVAAGLAPGALASRVWFALVGVTWLIGSLTAAAELLHQAVLVVALVSFPSGRPRGPIRWACVALAVPVAFHLVPRQWVPALFVAVALVSLAVVANGERWRPSYPASAAAAIAVARWSARGWPIEGVIDVDRATASPAATSWRWHRWRSATSSPATCSPPAGRTSHDWVLGDDAPRRPRRARRGAPGAVARSGPDDSCGRPDQERATPTTLVHGRIWTAPSEARCRSPMTGQCWESSTTGRVRWRTNRRRRPSPRPFSSAARHQRLQEHLAVQLDELQAARTRLVEAADRQRCPRRGTVARGGRRAGRARTADELRAIDADASHGGGGRGHRRRRAAVERGGRRDRRARGRRAPPVPLGEGRLREAVEALAVRSPIPVTLTATGRGGR